MSEMHTACLCPEPACLVEGGPGDVPRAITILLLLPDLATARVQRDAVLSSAWLELVRDHDLMNKWGPGMVPSSD